MTRVDRTDDFALTVSAWLHEDARHYPPDDLDAVLRRTRARRQRPAWSSLERWLPVQTTLRFSPAPRVAWILVVLALVIALGVAALAVGSGRHPLPPPFGPARNGAIVFGGTDHDIYALDPVTGATTALIGGSSTDHRPLLSPDGTSLLFLRETTAVDPVTSGFEQSVMVANTDGSNVRDLSGPLANLQDDMGTIAWSHDGSKVAIASSSGSTPVLQVFDAAGVAKPTSIDLQGMQALYVSFRPGDRELTLRGSTPDGDGLYAVGVDGRGLTTIVPPGQGDYASLSPDGTKIAYQVWDGVTGVIHVADVDTGRDSMPELAETSATAVVDDAPVWSPDSSRLLFVRYRNGGYQLAVGPAAGGPVIEIGPSMNGNSGRAFAQFSPDGNEVMAYFGDGSTWMLDPSGSTPGRQLPTSMTERAAWQRTAP